MKATVRLSTLAFAAGLAFQPALAEDRYEETLNTRQYVGGFASYVDVDEDLRMRRPRSRASRLVAVMMRTDPRPLD